ncbi:MAG: hypothetical protein K9J85_05560 [Desulfobacteraceae bacterium]|nr:hypothetical protein [Desulfobacteraceae bacterium]
MKRINKIKLSLIINIIIYAFIIQAFIRGATIILIEPSGNEMQIVYFVLQGIAAGYSIFCLIGMILRKPWSRIMALTWNIGLAIILGVLPISSILVFFSKDEINLTALIIDSNILIALLLSIVLIVLALILRSEGAKIYFTN